MFVHACVLCCELCVCVDECLCLRDRYMPTNSERKIIKFTAAATKKQKTENWMIKCNGKLQFHNFVMGLCAYV